MSEASTPSGGPVPKDAIDPELVKLGRPRPQIGVVTALAVVIFCLYVAVRLDGDRRFAGEPEAPRAVSAADVAAGKVPTDAHVTLAVRIERAPAVRAQPSPGNPGLRVAPVVGSRDKVWLALPGDGRSEPTVDARYRGRLYDFDELHFADPVRAHFARPQPMFVRGAELARLRTASATGGRLPTVSTGEVSVGADTPVEIEVADPQAATIVATLNDRFPDAAAWTAALVQAGAIASGTGPTRETVGGPVYEIRGPDAVAEATRKVEAAGLGGARVDPVTARHLAPWRDLAATESQLTFPGGATLPWSAIDVAAVWVPRAVPADARVLVVGETPEQYWYVLPIYIAVAVFGALFAWALARAIRRDFFPPT